MSGSSDKKLRKKARAMWTEACKEHPHLKEAAGKRVRRNIIRLMKGDTQVGETATEFKAGYDRLVQNLKWNAKNGLKGPKQDQIALDNAIAWSNAPQ